jgi:hypothetical protein
MNTLNTRFRHVLVREKNLTTHTFRKTGYLFALWGEADLKTTRVSATHKSNMMAQRYADSSLIFLQNATASDPDAKYQVGRFKMAINVHGETARSVSQDTTDNFTDLFQLSQLFLQQIGLGPNYEGRKHVLCVVELAVKFATESSPIMPCRRQAPTNYIRHCTTKSQPDE